jgi:hypothetical protein
MNKFNKIIDSIMPENFMQWASALNLLIFSFHLAIIFSAYPDYVPFYKFSLTEFLGFGLFAKIFFGFSHYVVPVWIFFVLMPMFFILLGAGLVVLPVIGGLCQFMISIFSPAVSVTLQKFPFQFYANLPESLGKISFWVVLFVVGIISVPGLLAWPWSRDN